MTLQTAKGKINVQICEAYFMFNNPNLGDCFKTNIAQLAIRFPATLHSLL